ncbi:MAG TPA: lipopolysaccharide biosynthesis protein [Desulfatirhabdiaceae bacterium]|nr:lipopolysaccharide biosynthesis protein [Desulfatirhabdiaceae bacterium]
MTADRRQAEGGKSGVLKKSLLYIVGIDVQSTKELFWIFFGQVGMGLGWFLGIKLMTRMISPEEFGRFSLGNTWMNLMLVVFFSPIGQGLMRYWSIARAQARVSDFGRASTRFRIILTAVSILLCVVLIVFSVLMDLKNWMGLIVLSISAGCASGWSNTDILILTADRRRQTASILNCVSACFKPISAALIILVTTSTADMALLGYLMVSLFLAGISGFFYQRAVTSSIGHSPISNGKEGNPLATEILSFSWPFLIWGAFIWIYQFCDRWALQMFHGPNVVGMFSVVSQLAFYPLVFLSGLLQLFFMPIAYDRAGGLKSAVDMAVAIRILMIMIGCYILCSLLLIGFYRLIGTWTVLLISSFRYTEYAPLLPWLTLDWSLFFLGQLLTGFGMLVNRTRSYIPAIIISSIVAAVLCLYLSRIQGPSGVVLGLGIAGLIYVVWSMWIARQVVIPERIRIGTAKADGQQ